MRWTRAAPARKGIAGRIFRERSSSARHERRWLAYGKSVWSWQPVAGVKPAEVCNARPGEASRQFAGDGGKTNSSPGRARHKPSTHCAGNAGVPRLYLYARVRLFYHHCTRDRGCSKHPAFPAPSHRGRQGSNLQTSGATCRENANAYSVVTREPSRHHPRRRVIQYARGRSDRIEKPRRTGYPACAGYDDPICGDCFDDPRCGDCSAPVIGRAFARPGGGV
jgi:hypothetical protein